MDSEYMERLYTIYSWPENPYSDEGRKRYIETLNAMEKILEHRWFKELVEGRECLRIIDFCGGYGLGGIALAKKAVERYRLSVELTIIDLRKKPLEIARRFSREELGFEVETIVGNVVEKIDLSSKYDIALLWGHSTPHFNPWDYVRLLANIHRSLGDHGIYFYEETDRIYSVFVRTGYRDVLPEIGGSNIVLTMHKEFDPLTGYFKRIAYNLDTHEHIEMKIYFWGLADSMTHTWIFFEDIDFIPLRSRYSGVVLARKPRKTIDPDKYFEELKILKISSIY